MTIDEAIQHCKEVAKENRKTALEYARAYACDTAHGCRECANEHEQLALWLTELKSRRIAAIKELERVKSPKTNGDRIRQMTDEELADWLTDGHDKCDICKLCSFGACRIESECEKGVLEWLKQEVREDAGTDD